jgi:hypothetical protein
MIWSAQCSYSPFVQRARQAAFAPFLGLLGHAVQNRSKPLSNIACPPALRNHAINSVPDCWPFFGADGYLANVYSARLANHDELASRLVFDFHRSDHLGIDLLTLRRNNELNCADFVVSHDKTPAPPEQKQRQAGGALFSLGINPSLAVSQK